MSKHIYNSLSYNPYGGNQKASEYIKKDVQRTASKLRQLNLLEDSHNLVNTILNEKLSIDTLKDPRNIRGLGLILLALGILFQSLNFVA